MNNPRPQEPVPNADRVYSREDVENLIWESVRSQGPEVLDHLLKQRERERGRWWGLHWRARRPTAALLNWLSFHPLLLVLVMVAVVWFLFLYQTPDMRANLEAGLWGVAGVGLAVWLVQELASEG